MHYTIVTLTTLFTVNFNGRLAFLRVWYKYPLTTCPNTKRLLQRAASEFISKETAVKSKISERFERIRELHNAHVKALREEALSVRNKKPIDRRWINYCIGQVKTERDILINDYGYAYHGSGDFTIPGTYFSRTPSSCLGWGLGAALGAKLAAPDQTVIACMGDGSYIYGNPIAAHLTSKKYGLPFLTIIYNNQCWGSARKLLSIEYPEGWAIKQYDRILHDLGPYPDFKHICESFGGYVETVEDPSEVQPALERALKAVKVEKRQALLNFIIAFGGVNKAPHETSLEDNSKRPYIQVSLFYLMILEKEDLYS
ncbi:MAG: thiamine pyrophosphate-dependent enzyme [Candidatus Bathyarchaeia archaeon]